MHTTVAEYMKRTVFSKISFTCRELLEYGFIDLATLFHQRDKYFCIRDVWLHLCKEFILTMINRNLHILAYLNFDSVAIA